MLERDLAIDGVSVRPSVRLSHAGITSILITVGSCGLHCRVGHRLQFFETNFRTQIPRKPIAGASHETGVGKNGDQSSNQSIEFIC